MAKQPFENLVQHLFQIAAQAEFKNLNDRDLLQRYVDHQDGLAFQELLRRYRMMIWCVCWHVLRHHQDVEDAFQATVITLMRRAKAILGRETIEGWLHTTAFKVASNAKALRNRRHVHEERIAKMRKENFGSDSYQAELAEVIDKELARIPEKFRSPLILYYLNGLTQKQAAQQLGISVDTFEWQLHQGRDRLQKQLSKHGLDLASTMPMAELVTGVHVPEIPSGLMEKTLDMVRIMALSNGALETATMSPQVALLVKETLGMTLKMKVLLASVLPLFLAVVGTGTLTYTGVLHILRSDQPQREKQETANKEPTEARSERTPRTDLYGDPLPPRAIARLGTVRFRPGEPGWLRWFGLISHKNIVAIANDNGVCLFHLDTGKPLNQLKDPSGEPFQIDAMSCDGRFLGGKSGKKEDYFLWDTATEKLVLLEVMRQFGLGLSSLEHSRDGKTVALRPLRGGDAYIVKSTTGKVLLKKNGYFRYMVYSLDGKTLLSASGDKSGLMIVHRWDVVTDKKLASWVIGEENICNFVFSPDGSMLATIPEHSGKDLVSIQLWDMTTGKKLRQSAEKSDPDTIYFSPDGKILATDSRSGKICLWNTNTGQMLRCWEGATGKRDGCDHLAFSSDGKLLASVGYVQNDSFVHIWDVATGKEMNKMQRERGHQGAVKLVSFSLDGKSLLSNGSSGSLRLWNTSVGAGQYRYRQFESDMHCYPFGNYVSAISPDGKIVAATGYSTRFDGQDSEAALRFWEASTGKELRSIQVPKAVPTGMAFSADGKLLAYSDSIGTIRLWDVAKGNLVDTLSGRRIVFAPNGKFLVTVSEDGGFILWDISTRKNLCKYGGYGSGVELISCPAISQDGQRLAMALKEKTTGKSFISLWNVQAGGKWFLAETLRSTRYESDVARFAAVEYPDDALAFSPDGKMLASTSKGGVVRLWETATGQERSHLAGHRGKVWSLTFSSDGRRLASGNEDTTILIWDVTGRLDDHGQLRPALLSTKQMEALWVDLAAEAAQASPSMWRFVAAGDATVAFFKKHLRPAPVRQVPVQAIAQWITDLDSNIYAVRRKAWQKLETLGEVAEPNLRQALEKNPSVELRNSLEQLLALVDKKRAAVLSDMALRDLRAIEILEQIGAREARQMLEVLSAGDPGVRKTQEAQAALRRLKAVQERS